MMLVHDMNFTTSVICMHMGTKLVMSLFCFFSYLFFFLAILFFLAYYAQYFARSCNILLQV